MNERDLALVQQKDEPAEIWEESTALRADQLPGSEFECSILPAFVCVPLP